MNDIDSHLAKRKMKVKNLSSNSSFITTVWKNEVVMGFFDVTTCRLTQIKCFRVLGSEEIKQLEVVITEYLY